MSTSSPTLAYQDSLDRDELSVEEKDGNTRIITPPLRNWKHIGRGFKIAICLLGTFTVLLLVIAVSDVKRGEWIGVIQFVQYAFITLIVGAVGSYRLRVSHVFEIEPNYLKITRRTRSHVLSSTSYRRDRVREVHCSEHNHKLIIPVTNIDLVELYISDDPAVVKVVALAVETALRNYSANVLQSLPTVVNNLTAEASPENRRIALMVIIASSTVSGAVLGVLTHAMAGFVVFVAGLVGCGIVLGTQEKKFWL